MTRVNVLLPFFRTPLKTNNSQIITEIIAQKYGLAPSYVYWIDSGDEQFECVIGVPNFKLNFECLREQVSRRREVEEMLRRLQGDVFNLIKKHEQLFQERKNMVPIQRLRYETGHDVQDSAVSIKIEQKPKNKQISFSDQQLISAVRQLTRQNLKLKDAIIFYEAQLQLMKGSEAPTLIVKPR